MGDKLVDALQPEVQRLSDVRRQTLVNLLLREGSDKFLTWQSSSTGKYHPQDEVTPKGMLIHVKRCAYIASDIARMYGLPEPLGDDVLIAGSLVHDLWKRGRENNEEHTQRDHMVISYEKVKDNDGVADDLFTYLLANACLHHEGRWTPGEAYRLEATPTIYATAMHTIDMITSRRSVWEVMRDEWMKENIGG